MSRLQNIFEDGVFRFPLPKAKYAIRDDALVEKLSATLDNIIGQTLLPKGVRGRPLLRFPPELEHGNGDEWKSNPHEYQVRAILKGLIYGRGIQTYLEIDKGLVNLSTSDVWQFIEAEPFPLKVAEVSEPVYSPQTALPLRSRIVLRCYGTFKGDYVVILALREGMLHAWDELSTSKRSANCAVLKYETRSVPSYEHLILAVAAPSNGCCTCVKEALWWPIEKLDAQAFTVW
ncbi:hypothetical protein K503DRAFT_854343 [Rhizopogon vinicolor AM-OR11-026]|uniref:Uncharacterized protein n=1 Tax=Rhizopogon vinicolor AM-OR11-026 TaxID=1314800 RepID=A0A1B7NAL1_9AGAM|nr:hypothetical protein K503DRAFT_854343 [Rhizopogon vinicolor AM-OR11-026]